MVAVSLSVLALVALAAQPTHPALAAQPDWRCTDKVSGPVRRQCRTSGTVAIGRTIVIPSPRFVRPPLDALGLVKVVSTPTGMQISGLREGTTCVLGETADTQFEVLLTVTTVRGPIPPLALTSKGWACERNSTKLGASRGRLPLPWVCRRALGVKVDEVKTLDVPRHTLGAVQSPEVLGVRFRSGYLWLHGEKSGRTRVLVWTDEALLELSVAVGDPVHDGGTE